MRVAVLVRSWAGFFLENSRKTSHEMGMSTAQACTKGASRSWGRGIFLVNSRTNLLL